MFVNDPIFNIAPKSDVLKKKDKKIIFGIFRNVMTKKDSI